MTRNIETKHLEYATALVSEATRYIGEERWEEATRQLADAVVELRKAIEQIITEQEKMLKNIEETLR